MAKSLRSKRKRSMRRIKRERYAVKELAKLKETVKDLSPDQMMECLPTIATPLYSRLEGEPIASNEAVPSSESGAKDAVKDVEMEPAVPQKSSGKYPPWYNLRKIKRQRIKESRKQLHDVAKTKQQRKNLKKKISKGNKKRGREAW